MPFGLSWETDDRIVFGQEREGIVQVSAIGGELVTIVPRKDDELLHGPQILPGGDTVLFTTGSLKVPAAMRWNAAQIAVHSLKTGQRKVLIEGGTDAHFVATGHIIYSAGRVLMAVPFDAARLELTGRPVAIVPGPLAVADCNCTAGLSTGSVHFTISSSGNLAYITGPALGGTFPDSQISFVDRNGNAKPVGLPTGGYSEVRISPDGKQLALAGIEQSVWIYDLSGATSMRRLTFEGTQNHHPVWTPDGTRIVYRSNRDEVFSVLWRAADGSEGAERLTTPEPGTSHGADSFLPGQLKFFYVLIKPGSDIWLYSIPDKKSTPVVVDPGNQNNAFPSPDGRWLAYQSDETGRYEIFVQPFPPNGGKFQITREGGQHALWSPDGKELFYENAGHLMSEAIRTTPSFSFGDPVAMPIPEFFQSQGLAPRQYSITPDGKQFIMKFRSANSSMPSAQIQLVLNWFEELQERAAAN
jgi:serine/threonine-protein kinase